MILFDPNGFGAEAYGDQGGKSFIKGDNVFIFENRDGFPVPPHRGLSLPDFIHGEMGPKSDIQKSPAGTFPNLFFQRESLVTFCTNQMINRYVSMAIGQDSDCPNFSGHGSVLRLSSAGFPDKYMVDSFLIGNVFEKNLAEIYDSKAAKRYRAGSKACRSCSIHPVCGGCLAVIHGLGLDVFEKRDPFCFI
jgi:radical SAM protein with 4Fe4S-binding SPASM domain